MLTWTREGLQVSRAFVTTQRMLTKEKEEVNGKWRIEEPLLSIYHLPFTIYFSCNTSLALM
jgi:hypothetical protein